MRRRRGRGRHDLARFSNIALTSPPCSGVWGASQIAKEFVFLAPVHLWCPFAGTFLMGTLFRYCQWDVQVKNGIGCGAEFVLLLMRIQL